MRRLLLIVGLLALTSSAHAQIVPPPVPSIVPPPPAPSAPPPPKIEVPEVPKLDQPIPKAKASSPKRTSFHQRVVRCLDDEVAATLPARQRAAYAGACANQGD